MQMLNSESESNIKRQSLVWKSHTAQAKKKKTVWKARSTDEMCAMNDKENKVVQ